MSMSCLNKRPIRGPFMPRRGGYLHLAFTDLLAFLGRRHLWFFVLLSEQYSLNIAGVGKWSWKAIELNNWPVTCYPQFFAKLIVLLSIQCKEPSCLLIVHCDSVFVFRVSWLQFWTDIRVWAQFITFEYRLRIYPKWPGLRAKKGDDGRITTPPNL